MIDVDSVTIATSDDRAMTIKAEQFLIQKYKLWGYSTFDRRTAQDGAVDIELMAKGSAEKMLFDYIRTFVKVIGPVDRGIRSAEYIAEIDLPYIRSKAMEDLDRQLIATQAARNKARELNSKYFVKVHNLEQEIKYLRTPWYIKFHDWLTLP